MATAAIGVVLLLALIAAVYRLGKKSAQKEHLEKDVENVEIEAKKWANRPRNGHDLADRLRADAAKKDKP